MRDEIWAYVMAIRDNLKVQLRPPKEGRKEALQHQRKVVVSFEKKLFKDIEDDHDLEVFIQSSINCAIGDYEFEDLLFLYETLKAKKSI